MIEKTTLSKINALFRGRQNIVVSNLLRERGYNYKVAFGCSVPDIKGVAMMVKDGLTDPDSLFCGLDEVELSEALWADENLREAKMAAPMLYPRGTMTLETAERWADGIPTYEVADMVCMYAFQFGIGQPLIERWEQSEDKMRAYCAKNLIKRLS